MLPETYTTLQDHSFIRGEGQIDRAKLAVACRDILLGQPVASDDDIEPNGLIVADLRQRLFGDIDSEDVERELDGILGPLTGPTGPVQKQLENGYVLCSAPVARRLTGGESTITLKRQARFVTENHDLIVQHYWAPKRERILRDIDALNGAFELSIRRQPALAARKPALIGHVHEQVQLKLPAGSAS